MWYGVLNANITPQCLYLSLHLAVFPVVQPPATTSFQLYREKSHLVPEGAEAHHVLKGSTEAIEYFSAAAGEQSNEDIACQ